jgi:hypothetical protein
LNGDKTLRPNKTSGTRDGFKGGLTGAMAPPQFQKATKKKLGKKNYKVKKIKFSLLAPTNNFFGPLAPAYKSFWLCPCLALIGVVNLIQV